MFERFENLNQEVKKKWEEKEMLEDEVRTFKKEVAELEAK